jgi:hypothetical protein
MCARRGQELAGLPPRPAEQRRSRWFAARAAAYSCHARTRALSRAGTLAPTASAPSDERRYPAAPGDSAVRAATAAGDDYRIQQADSLDRGLVSRSLRRFAPRHRAVSRPSRGRDRRSQRVRYRRRPVLRLRRPDLRVGTARIAGFAAAHLVALAAGRRHRFYRFADVRRRQRERPAVNSAFSAARRQRLVVALADRIFPRCAGQLGADCARQLALARRPDIAIADPADRARRIRLFCERLGRRRAWPLHPGQRGPGRATQYRRRQSRTGQPAHHSGHAGRCA